MDLQNLLTNVLYVIYANDVHLKRKLTLEELISSLEPLIEETRIQSKNSYSEREITKFVKEELHNLEKSGIIKTDDYVSFTKVGMEIHDKIAKKVRENKDSLR